MESEGNMNRLTRMFLDNPYQEFYLREAARKVKLSVFATKKYADSLVLRGILKEEKRANLRFLKANLENRAVRLIKTAAEVEDIISSGLVEYIKENVPAISSVILFGSVAKGEDTDKSDIDLAIIGKNNHLDFSNFEKKIGKSINAHFFSWNEWKGQATKNKAFYLDVIVHGIALHGEVPVVNGN